MALIDRAMGRGREIRRTEEEHRRIASRLDRLRRTLVRPLCAPAFVAGLSWLAHGAARSAAPVWLSRLAMVSTLLSPLCLAIAFVLTVVPSRHRPLGEVRTDWVVMAATLGCTAFALAALARHMAEL